MTKWWKRTHVHLIYNRLQVMLDFKRGYCQLVDMGTCITRLERKNYNVYCRQLDARSTRL